MADMNKVILIGNLTRDPQLRRTPSGTAVADVGLAVSDNYKNREGQLVERVCFVDVVVWGRQAETTEQYLKKGSPALIEGRLVYDSWENDKGEKRSRLKVQAERVQFLGGRPRSDQASPEAAQSRTRNENPPAQFDTSDMSSGDQGADPDDLPF